MRTSGFSHYALTSCVAAAMLAGCGGSQPPIGAPGAMPLAPALAPAQTGAHNNRAASLYDQALHRRGSGSPERWPVARLLDVNGTLYGTDSYGGKYGWGEVFSISDA